MNINAQLWSESDHYCVVLTHPIVDPREVTWGQSRSASTRFLSAHSLVISAYYGQQAKRLQRMIHAPTAHCGQDQVTKKQPI